MSSQAINTFSLQNPPNSVNLMSKDSVGARVLVKNNNCSIHIFLLYIVLAISSIITVSAIYISKSSQHIATVNQTNYGPATRRNPNKKTLLCTLNPLIKDWYFMSQYNPGYTCEPFEKVNSVNVQSLQVGGHVCNDTGNCYDLIRTYLGIMEGHSRFSFFVDNDANVYGGRGFFCNFWAGQLWVAVMVDGFAAASQTEKDRILHNFKEGVMPHAQNCSINLSDLQFHYYDGIVI